MTHSDDFTIDYCQRPDGSLADFRLTRSKALYRLPWWRRWFMSWRWFRIYPKPAMPFPVDPSHKW
jgi:hypothetical protein